MSRIEAVDLYLTRLDLAQPFTTSRGTESQRESILVRVTTDQAQGWGECVAFPHSHYGGESNAEAWTALTEALIPIALAEEEGARGLERSLTAVPGRALAKAPLVNALYDAELRASGIRMADDLSGGSPQQVACGIALGLAPIDQLLEQVEAALARGYQRVKLKIEPGADHVTARLVREAFPQAPLSVDANGAYTPDDMDVFQRLDGLELEMIEQPLAPDDLDSSAKLQSALVTPICLDESVTSADVVRRAAEMGACRIVCIKQGRMGGLFEALRAAETAERTGLRSWVGGMLETAVGRCVDLALASHPAFTLPADVSEPSRYFVSDLFAAPQLDANGSAAAPAGLGLGVGPDAELLERFTVKKASFSAKE